MIVVRILVLMTLIAAGAVVALSAGDIVRYLKMRSM